MEARITVEELVNQIDDYKRQRNVKHLTGFFAFCCNLVSLVMVGAGLANGETFIFVFGIICTLVNGSFFYGWWNRKRRFYIPFMCASNAINALCGIVTLIAAIMVICELTGNDKKLNPDAQGNLFFMIVFILGHFFVDMIILIDFVNIGDAMPDPVREKLAKHFV